jgi:predicted phage-related endonuclease
MNTIVNLKTHDLSYAALSAVDKLGFIQRQIDTLKEQEAALKDAIKNEGEGVQVGKYFTTDVKLSQRTTVDHKTLLAELEVPAALIAKYSKSTAVISITVKPIKGE